MTVAWPTRVVIDTSVLVAATRSRRGASFALIRRIPDRDFTPCLSVGLYAEWQDVLSRPEHLVPGRSVVDVEAFLAYLAAQSHLQEVHFLWRPFLSDPADDMLLELAFAAGASLIITHNTRDFRGSERLGVSAVTPRDFLALLSGRRP